MLLNWNFVADRLCLCVWVSVCVCACAFNSKPLLWTRDIKYIKVPSLWKILTSLRESIAKKRPLKKRNLKFQPISKFQLKIKFWWLLKYEPLFHTKSELKWTLWRHLYFLYFAEPSLLIGKVDICLGSLIFRFLPILKCV